MALGMGVYRPQCTRQRRSSLIDSCRHRATVLQICKHRSRRSIVLPFSKVIFSIFQIIFANLFHCVTSHFSRFTQVRLGIRYCTRIWRLSHGCFRIGIYIKPERQHLPETKSRANVDRGLDIDADMKTAV